MPGITRRRLLQGSALLPALPTLNRFEGLFVAAAPFVAGVNYPWVSYAHDFGENDWGHDGVITSGWAAQKYQDSQGFIDTRLSSDRAHSGSKSLRIQADLAGGDPHRSQGEAYLDLRNHPPRGTTAPVDMTGVTASCWVFLPKGSAGEASAPNGLQMFFKSQESPDSPFLSWYSPWTNFQTHFENGWTRFTADLAGLAGFMDTNFNPAKVVVVGIKIGIGSGSAARLSGFIYLDDFAVDTTPPITFDFEVLEIERDFATLHRVLHNCPQRVVRVFVFGDGRAAPRFNLQGRVTGLDNSFFEDFDELLRIAQRQGLLLLPVLLDFHWLDSPQLVSGVQTGGHAGVIRDPALRRTFFRRALIPLVERYADDPNIFAFEIINEPEWALKDLETDSTVGDPVLTEEMRDFVRLSAQVLQARTSLPVTVGSARRKWVSLWQDCGLDLYQFHWYDKFAAEEPFPWLPYAQLGLDRPCLIGEVATASTAHTAEEYLQAARAGGYRGLLLWSYRAGDDFSGFQQARGDLQGWCSNRICQPRWTGAISGS
jgi:hypothetical protein